MSTLKERIAALQANSGLTPPGNGSSRSSTPSPGPQRSPSEKVPANRLSDKIARFDKLGGAPVPRSGFGLGSPPPPVSIPRNTSHSSDLWSKQLATDAKLTRSTSNRFSREPSEEQPTSPTEPRPFETIKARPPSVLSARSHLERGLISPQITGEPLGLPRRSQSLRPESPTPLPKSLVSSVEEPMAMLTTAAVSNLPASPTLRSTDATSSVATEIDVSSERAGLTPLTTPNFSRPVSAMSSPAIEVPLALSSVTSTRAVSRIASRDVVSLESTPMKARPESLPPKDTPPKTESTSPPASISSSPAQPLIPALTGTSIESGPRPSTPSYLAQAAAYFPPARNPNRQSSIFQVPSSIRSLSPTPRTPPREPSILSLTSSRSAASESPKRAPSTASAGQKASPANPSLALTPESDSIRTSVDTAYFSVAENENEDFIFLASAVDEGEPRNAQLDTDNTTAAPKTPTSSTNNLISSQVTVARTSSISTPSQLQPPRVSPRPPPEPSTASRAASLSSIQAKLGLLPSAKKTAAGGSIRNSGSRRRSALLIPGKWIESDDEDDCDEAEEGGMGWARIVVAGGQAK